jgi:hypothetical protein
VAELVQVDGSIGGGQILRSALSLSALTGRPFVIEQIRKQRERPGLLRQHLTAVRAAAEICDAEVLGGELGSTRVQFHPAAVRAGEYVRGWTASQSADSSLAERRDLPGPQRVSAGLTRAGARRRDCSAAWLDLFVRPERRGALLAPR